LTAREALEKTAPWLKRHGVASARLDAEVLLAHVLGTERLRLYLDLDRPLDDAETGRYRDLVLRRSKGEPVAYLTGCREFYGLPMRVRAGVFIPRPETEMLVDYARERNPATILDLCTGSGCVAIACAVRLPGAAIVATELDPGSLEVARGNAEANGVSGRIRFLEGDLFAPLGADETFDLILSNPPYVAEGEAAGVAAFEPGRALYAGSAGLEVIRRILAEAPRRLRPGGAVALEIGEDQGESARPFASSFRRVEVRRDLAGHPRLLIAEA